MGSLAELTSATDRASAPGFMKKPERQEVVSPNQRSGRPESADEAMTSSRLNSSQSPVSGRSDAAGSARIETGLCAHRVAATAIDYSIA